MLAFLLIIIIYSIFLILVISNKTKLLSEYILVYIFIDFNSNVITLFNVEFLFWQYITLNILWLIILLSLFLKIKFNSTKNIYEKNIVLIVFTIYIIFNSLINFYGKDTLSYILGNLFIPFLLYKIYQSFTVEDFFQIFISFIKKALLISIFLVFLSFILSGFHLTGLNEQNIRLTTFINPSKFGKRLFFLFVVYLVLLMEYDKYAFLKAIKKYEILLALLVIVIFFVFNQSRGSIIASLIVIFFIIFIYRVNVKKLIYISFFFVLSLIMMFNLPNQLSRGLNVLAQIKDIENIPMNFSTPFSFFSEMERNRQYNDIFSGRFVLWYNILLITGENVILGKGVNYGKYYYGVSSTVKAGFVESAIVNSNYHNDLLLFYVTLGLIGLILYLFTYFYFLIYFYRISRTNYEKLSIIGFIMFLFLLGGIFISFFDNFFGSSNLLLFSFLGFLYKYKSEHI